MRAFALAIVETVHHPLLVIGTDFVVRAANTAFHATFSIPVSQAPGKSVFVLNRALDTPELREGVEKAAATGHGFEGLEFEFDIPGNGTKSFLIDARRVVSEDEPSPLILLALDDVTDKKRVQDTLRQLNDDLETRVRERTAQLEVANAELEAFCYSVSHDLRAPLRAIDGFSQELLQSYAEKLDDQGKHYLRRIRASSQRMAELIDDLLQLSRISRVQMRCEMVDLSALATAVISDLRQQTPNRQVTITITPGLAAQGDPGLLRVALDNLIGNAWKFTSKRHHSTITFGREGHEFFVQDDGAGFEQQFVGRLFGAFQRLHNERDFPGTGIGLATVHRIISRHGGTVRASGAVGQGATFYFTLHEINEWHEK